MVDQENIRRIRFRLKVLIALHEERTGESLTYQRLSDGAKISTNTITRMANNNQKRVDLGVLEKLCNFFNCELSDLMRLEPPAADSPES